jgi:hypothetical protein
LLQTASVCGTPTSRAVWQCDADESALNKSNENRNSKVWKKLTIESKDGGAQRHAQDHEQPDPRAGAQA